MICDRLIPAIKEAFPDKPFVFASPPDPVIRLPSGFAEIGELAIYDDGEEARVCITAITHNHFPYEENLTSDILDQKVTEEIIAFLRAPFGDNYSSP